MEIPLSSFEQFATTSTGRYFLDVYAKFDYSTFVYTINYWINNYKDPTAIEIYNFICSQHN